MDQIARCRYSRSGTFRYHPQCRSVYSRIRRKMVLMAKPERKLSLAPLSFDEAVTDILKIKPEPNTTVL